MHDTPRILGILNITSDSFSDGGAYLDPAAAVARAESLSTDGAWAIDIGGVSSNPDAASVAPSLEQDRILPVIQSLLAKKIRVSVDSFQVETQRRVLSLPIDFLNDIQGFPDPDLYPALADASCQIIIMHSVQRRGIATRVDVSPDRILSLVLDFFDERIGSLERAGVNRSRIIVDPGMGFFLGSNPGASLVVLRSLGEIKKRYDLPVMVSVSRKSFLGVLTGRAVAERGAATLAAEMEAVRFGADYVRTHEPKFLVDALKVVAAIANQGNGKFPG